MNDRVSRRRLQLIEKPGNNFLLCNYNTGDKGGQNDQGVHKRRRIQSYFWQYLFRRKCSILSINCCSCSNYGKASPQWLFSNLRLVSTTGPLWAGSNVFLRYQRCELQSTIKCKNFNLKLSAEETKNVKNGA